MIDFATLFAWFVIAVLFSVFVAAIVALGSLPGHIARQRNHPHAEAINVASWLGLALGGIGWPFAFVWAFVPFGNSPASAATASPGEVDQLRQEIAQLKTELTQLKQGTS